MSNNSKHTYILILVLLAIGCLMTGIVLLFMREPQGALVFFGFFLFLVVVSAFWMKVWGLDKE